MEEFSCPAKEEYNVLDLVDKPCCFKYHKYCEDVKDCDWKNLWKSLKGEEVGPNIVKNDFSCMCMVLNHICRSSRNYRTHEYK